MDGQQHSAGNISTSGFEDWDKAKEKEQNQNAGA